LISIDSCHKPLITSIEKKHGLKTTSVGLPKHHPTIKSAEMQKKKHNKKNGGTLQYMLHSTYQQIKERQIYFVNCDIFVISMINKGPLPLCFAPPPPFILYIATTTRQVPKITRLTWLQTYIHTH